MSFGQLQEGKVSHNKVFASAVSFDIDEEFDIMLLEYPQPATKPAMSFHGHNEVETSISLRKRGKDGMTPSTNINLFKTDNNMVHKSIVSNASSIIPSSANSFVIIGDEQLSSLIERPRTLPAIVEISEKEASSESS
jgi:hypothetical protein